ncbi:MAG: c-type cytochrome biogenesis protein CcmI [Chloroflexota bacterium]
MWYLLGALVVVVVLAFVVLPLVRRRASTSGSVPVVASPAEERAAIYGELIELELDQRVGKVDEADYQALSETLLARAAELIAVEDALSGDADSEVEREIAAAREAIRLGASSAREPRA